MNTPSPQPFDINLLLQEVTYLVSRSSGKGGQNVNKVSSKVELRFDLSASQALTMEQKERIRQRAATRITADGVLRLTCQEARTQFMNKKAVNEKLITLLMKCLQPVKKRIPSVIPEAAREERLKEKKKTSEKKLLRKPDRTS